MRALPLLLVLVASPAWGSAEPRHTTSGRTEHWTSSVTIVLDPSLETLGAGATLAIEQALGTWLMSVAHLPNVSFERATSAQATGQDGKNVVLAGPITTPGFEDAIALTTTYAADATGEILEADILFNSAYTFAQLGGASCSGTYDIQSIATHEAGHFFGLDEDWTDDTTTMFVHSSACDTHKRLLTPSDTSSLEALYASPTVVTAHCAAAGAATPGGWAGWGAGLVALSGLGLLRARSAGKRRR